MSDTQGECSHCAQNQVQDEESHFVELRLVYTKLSQAETTANHGPSLPAAGGLSLLSFRRLQAPLVP